LVTRTTEESYFRTNLSLLVLAVFLLSTAPLFAQDTPLGAAGTQVATEQTPAAATNADALRKASQNPVASLISVPIQNTAILALVRMIAFKMC
jgi:hypothetical protein